MKQPNLVSYHTLSEIEWWKRSDWETFVWSLHEFNSLAFVGAF